MIVLLIGPHRSGKTTLAKAIAGQISGAKHFDLDEVMADAEGSDIMTLCRALGDTQFSLLCRKHVDQIRQTAELDLGLIAVGAGAFLDASTALSWLSHYHAVALMADPEQLYNRADKNEFGTFDHYVTNQLSDERMSVYKSACFTVNVSSGNQQESERTLLRHLIDIKAVDVNGG